MKTLKAIMNDRTIKNICILTGAGISKESGLQTFRDQNGLWENHDIYEVASPKAFQNNPELVYEFYNQRRSQLLSSAVAPNMAHQELGRLEKNHRFNVTIITQNVDDLHERGGSHKVIHMHGELLKARCTKTNKIYEWRGLLDKESRCSCCHTKGNLRPHIVWFGEIPLKMKEAQEALEKCDLFVSIGTSGAVYPAASFVNLAKEHGAYCIEINPHPTHNAHVFDQTISKMASKGVKEFVDTLLEP